MRMLTWIVVGLFGVFIVIVLFLAICIGTLPVAALLGVSLKAGFAITTAIVVVIESVAFTIVKLRY